MIDNPSPDELRRIYETSRVIAVVGASSDPSNAAHAIPSYLQDVGYHIVPVNPHHGEIFGEPSFPTLMDIPFPVDVVEVFRPSEHVPRIAQEAATIGANVLWLQKGIVSDEAAVIAVEAEMVFVSDLCMGATHAAMELGGPPSVNS